ncbi:hypothetical protein ACFU5Z_16415 [Streptomyces sp. NPDC057521]|uniref:hypothetical protein n=1 Tax=Streptomyces sp. NPDC057521 TaxID=3346156 RepID=UPI0036761712
MPSTTALDEATAMIEKAWGRPVEELEPLAKQRPCADPLLRSVMHIRSSLVSSDLVVSEDQGRLRALARTDQSQGWHDLERIARIANDLRFARVEHNISLRAISYVIEAREAAAPRDQAPAALRAQAAVARSGHTTTPPGSVPASPAPSAAASPPAPATVPRHH